MIDFDPNTWFDQQHTIAGLTVSPVTRTEDKVQQGGDGDVNCYVYSSNSRSLSTGRHVAIPSDLVNRTSFTGKTGSNSITDMPGKLRARKTGVHRTPTKEGFRFGITAGIF